MLHFDRDLPANRSATPLCCVFPMSIRGRWSGNFSDTNAGSLKSEEDSTSLATIRALYDFRNSARTFSFPWTSNDSQGLYSDCRVLEQKVSGNSKHGEIDSGSVKKFPSESQLNKYPCIGSITHHKSTPVTPTLLDTSETWRNLEAMWPKQGQHNLDNF